MIGSWLAVAAVLFALEFAWEMAQAGLFVGLGENDSPLPWIEMIRDEKSVFTTFAYAPRDFLAALRIVESRQIDLRPWTETRPLEDGQAGFEKIAYAPGSTLKMVFEV